MGRETFSERNRRRREANAFMNLYEYARAQGVAQPERAAQQAAALLHGSVTADAAPRRRPPSKSPSRRSGRTRAAAAVPHLLEDRNKQQLMERAQELDIAGRSSMSKDELIKAIRARN